MNTLTNLELIKDRMNYVQNLLSREEEFDDKQELVEYIKEIKTNFIFLRALIDITYR